MENEKTIMGIKLFPVSKEMYVSELFGITEDRSDEILEQLEIELTKLRAKEQFLGSELVEASMVVAKNLQEMAMILFHVGVVSEEMRRRQEEHQRQRANEAANKIVEQLLNEFLESKKMNHETGRKKRNN